MKNLVISVLGQDRPGIVASVTQILANLGCYINDLRQTILQNEFSAIFIVENRKNYPAEEIRTNLDKILCPQGLTIYVKPLSSKILDNYVQSSPFLIIVKGKDMSLALSDFSKIVADYGCNIEHMLGISQELEENRSLVFEIQIPEQVNLFDFRTTLKEIAQKNGLEFSLQHRAIFEETHRI